MKLTLTNEGSGDLYKTIMKAICGETENKSMADIMCYHSPYNSQLGFSERCYVDILDRKLDDRKEQDFFIQKDVVEFLKECKNYDAIICSDGCEHLQKETGLQLIELMKSKSGKQIIFTPLGAYMLEEEKSNDPDTHKSGWLPEDFEGWAIIQFPYFHPALNHGAFFAWSCNNIQEDFYRVVNELKNYIHDKS